MWTKIKDVVGILSQIFVVRNHAKLYLGDRVYQVIRCLKENEQTINGEDLVKRSLELDAFLGEDEGVYIEKYKKYLPPLIFGGEILFIFPDWSDVSNPDYLYRRFVYGFKFSNYFHCWQKNQFYLGGQDGVFGKDVFLLRRLK